MNTMLARINSFLEKAMPLLAFLGVILGVLFYPFFLQIRPFIPWLFALITLSGSLTLRVRDLGKSVSSPLPFVLFFIVSHVIMPLFVFLIASAIFENNPDTLSGYILLYAMPTAVTSFIWVSIFRGDLSLALAFILLDSLLAPVLVPLKMRLFLGANIELNMTGLVIALIFMVVIPTVMGVSLNESSRGKIPLFISPWLNPASKICFFVVISGNSAAVATQIHPANPLLWIVFVVCLGFAVMAFVLGKLTGLLGKINRQKQIAIFFASGLRNMSSALVLAVEFLPPAAALPAVLGILVQQASAAVMGRLFLGNSDR